MTRSFDALHTDPFASGAWPLLSWVSDGTRELCPRFDLVLGEFSCCQFLVGEMLSNYRNHEAIQPLKSVTAHVAHVKAKRKLIHIAMQMLLRNLMIHAVHSALEHSPNAFNAVSADSVLGVDSRRVIDGFMAKEETVKADVPGRLIREDRGTYFDVGMDSRLQSSHIGSLNRHRYGASAALPESYNGSLADAATSGLELFVFVLIALLSADEAFVHFDDAAQLIKVIARAARLTQTLEHKPSRLLRDADLLRQLQARDALACGNEQVHGVEPLVQGNVAALEDRACADREIEGTGVAAVETNLWLLADALTALALRTERAIRPEPRFQVNSCRLRRREHLEKLESRYCAFAHISLGLFRFSAKSMAICNPSCNPFEYDLSTAGMTCAVRSAALNSSARSASVRYLMVGLGKLYPQLVAVSTDWAAMILGGCRRTSVAHGFSAYSATVPAPYFCWEFSANFAPRWLTSLQSPLFSASDFRIGTMLLFRHERFIHWESNANLIHNVPDPSLYRSTYGQSRGPISPTASTTANVCFRGMIALDTFEPMDRQDISPDRISLFGSHAEALLAGKHSDQLTLSLASKVSGSPMLSRSFAS